MGFTGSADATVSKAPSTTTSAAPAASALAADFCSTLGLVTSGCCSLPWLDASGGAARAMTTCPLSMAFSSCFGSERLRLREALRDRERLRERERFLDELRLRRLERERLPRARLGRDPLRPRFLDGLRARFEGELLPALFLDGLRGAGGARQVNRMSKGASTS